MARFGVPAHLTSDQGAQFTSALWARLCDVIGLHHNTTTVYHPQSNGMIERAHRRLKEALKARMAAMSRPVWVPYEAAMTTASWISEQYLPPPNCETRPLQSSACQHPICAPWQKLAYLWSPPRAPPLGGAVASLSHRRQLMENGTKVTGL